MNAIPKHRRGLIQWLFWLLLAAFALTVLVIFADDFVDRITRGLGPEPLFVLISTQIFLGTVLFIVVLRTKMTHSLKRFLLLMGGSMVAIALGIVLHNLLYAAATMVEDIGWAHSILSAAEAGFFLAALFVFPATFLIGAAGALYITFRHRRPPDSPNHMGTPLAT